MVCLQWCDCSKNDSISEDLCFFTSFSEIPPPIILFVFGIPYIFKLIQYPRVKPTNSWKYVAKLLLCIVAGGCSIGLTVYSFSGPILYRISLFLTSLGWSFAALLVVLGNFRVQPQSWVLRIWWFSTFVSGAILFFLHHRLHLPQHVNTIRGGYLFCVLILAILSLFPQDQPEYSEVRIDRIGSRLSIQTSPSQPLLGEASTTPSVSTTGVTSTSGRRTSIPAPLERQLSKHTVYGATDSEYKQVFLAWDKALHSHNKLDEQNQLHSLEGVQELQEDEVSEGSSGDEELEVEENEETAAENESNLAIL